MLFRPMVNSKGFKEQLSIRYMYDFRIGTLYQTKIGLGSVTPQPEDPHCKLCTWTTAYIHIYADKQLRVSSRWSQVRWMEGIGSNMNLIPFLEKWDGIQIKKHQRETYPYLLGPPDPRLCFCLCLSGRLDGFIRALIVGLGRHCGRLARLLGLGLWLQNSPARVTNQQKTLWKPFQIEKNIVSESQSVLCILCNAWDLIKLHIFLNPWLKCN